MTYLELSDQAQENAIINYCNIMRLSPNDWREKVINFFITYNYNNLDESGQIKTNQQ